MPTGAYGDLLSMIEMRAEDIGLTDFIPKETLAAAGISDTEFRESMDALNEARDELFMATDELRRQGPVSYKHLRAHETLRYRE